MFNAFGPTAYASGVLQCANSPHGCIVIKMSTGKERVVLDSMRIGSNEVFSSHGDVAFRPHIFRGRRSSGATSIISLRSVLTLIGDWPFFCCFPQLAQTMPPGPL